MAEKGCETIREAARVNRNANESHLCIMLNGHYVKSDIMLNWGFAELPRRGNSQGGQGGQGGEVPRRPRRANSTETAKAAKAA